MIAPPDQTVKPPRPEGNFGTQITIALDGGYKTLWLSGITTSASDIFCTPSDLRLGIPIGQMLNSLLQGTPLEGDLPEVFKFARVDRLELKKPVGKSNFSFGLEISVTYDDSDVRFWLMLEKAAPDGKEKYQFALKIRLGDPHNPSIELDVSVDKDGIFAHRKQDEHNPKSFNLAPLGRVLSPELEKMMGAIEITPLEMAIGSYKASDEPTQNKTSTQPYQENARSYVLAFRLQGNVSLSQLPFVSERLPKDADVGISGLSLVWCSAAIAKDDNAYNYFVEKYNKSKPQNSDNHTLITDKSLSSGGLFSAKLQVPLVKSEDISLPFKSPTKSANPDLPQSIGSPSTKTESDSKKTKPAVLSSANAASDDPAKWFEVNKNVGPLSLKRMGLKYQDKKIWFLFDTSLNAGAVTLIIDGLGAGIDPFELLGGRFKPAFTLRGLGLIIKGPAEVSGAFLAIASPIPVATMMNSLALC